MNNAQAAALVKDLFTRPFNKDLYARFAGELLHTLEPAAFTQAGTRIWESFRRDVVSFDRIGKYQCTDDRRLDVLCVKLRAATTLERARTLQRNFVAKYLKEGRGGHWKDASLVAFHVEGNPDWRLSLVSMETHLAAGEVQEDLSPARRLSFLVGENESSHTAQKRFLPLLQDGRPAPKLDDLQNAFNIEIVTQEFFKKYKELFERLQAGLQNALKMSTSARREFDAKKIDEAEFAKKLLGQIVFLYFLQKKGWFGVARDAAWGTGPKNFLRDLFKKEYGGYKNFFNDILEPLFYEALATPEREGEYYSRFNCKIPFLNGGLFDPMGGYSWVHADLPLADELFSNERPTPEGDQGDGILDVFDRYNFTVCEDEPLEKEVAVDPEMLGKVFENLLDKDGRHATGTYYTPREVVHHMCQRALLEYLSGKAGTSIQPEDLSLFLRHGVDWEEHEERVVRGGETPTYTHKLPESIRRRADDIDAWLADLTVCDPAIGSGAFPLGMMAEIVRSRRLLAKLMKKDGQPGHTPYDFKRHAIQHTLHGVDLAPGAVEIAKLRLWLSLVVDEDDIRTIKPLPNLDYKIMQGNSLLESVEGVRLIENLWQDKSGVPNDYNGPARKALQTELLALSVGRVTGEKRARIKEINRKLEKLGASSGPKTRSDQSTLDFHGTGSRAKAEELKGLQNAYFSEISKRKKEDLKQRIETLEWDVVEAALRGEGKKEALKRLEADRHENIRRYFLWHLHFADVFQENGGFDVVIGNPPYVRQEDIKDQKPTLEAEGYRTFSGTADLYVYFYERGIQLLRDGGTLAFITSNKFFRAAYGEKLRAYLGETTSIKEVVDFGDAGEVFEAIAYPSIVVVVKSKPDSDAATVRALIWPKEMPLDQVDREAEGKSSLLLAQRTLTSEGWRFLMPSEARLLEKLRAAGQPLGEYVKGRFYRGILTGLNEAFVVDRATRDRLIKEHSSSKELLKPFLRGRDVKRWRVDFADQYLVKIESSDNVRHPWSEKTEKEAEKIFAQRFPALHGHFESLRDVKLDKPDERGCRNMFEKLQKRDDQGQFYWELRPCVYWQEFERPKVILGRFMNSAMFAFDRESYLHNDALYMIPVESEIVVAILNSSPAWFFLKQTCTDLQNGYLQAYRENLFQIPIPSMSGKMKADIDEAVARILNRKKGNPSADITALENELNERVCQAYGLNKEDVTFLGKDDLAAFKGRG